MAPADVDMKPADKEEKKGEETGEEEKKEEKKPPLTPPQEIKVNVQLIERGVSMLEPRFMQRVLRTLTSLRKKLDGRVLKTAIEDIYVKDVPEKKILLGWIPQATLQISDSRMDIDMTSAPAPSTTTPHLKQNGASQPPSDPLPESEVYLRLLLIHFLMDKEEYRPKAKDLAHETIEKIRAWNRRSMDPLAARVWLALGRAYELAGQMENVRPLLLVAQKTASLRHDDECQATLINLLLRNYLHYNLYDQADQLVAKTHFPESAHNPQLARKHYYLGRIRAVQLNYSDAHEELTQAIRRAPSAETAPGFWQAVHKFSVVVELLMGEIPDRSTFRHPVLEHALSGYFEIVRAVRTGSLQKFTDTLSKYAAQFSADKTYTLIVRLRQNVIKTGVRRLSLSYNRISLRDICLKLHLDSEEDAEYIVGKAIRDGVIDGKVNHEKGWLECRGSKNRYGSDVAEAYQRRIEFCLKLHNESVKAMRYPLNAHRKDLAAAEGAREREKEITKGIQEGDIDDEDDLGF